MKPCRLHLLVIVGVLYRTAFEPGYDRFPRHAQLLVIGALVLVLAAFILLMAPVAYHRIVDCGENRPNLHSFVLAIMKPTLPLFALSMGLTLYIATEKVDGVALAAICSFTGAGLALMLWYDRAKHRAPDGPGRPPSHRRTGREY
jgi:hypothetical protein